jgi:hypothetical protein
MSDHQVWETVKAMEDAYVAMVIDYAAVLGTLSMPENRRLVEAGDQVAIERLWHYVDRAKAKLDSQDA